MKNKWCQRQAESLKEYSGGKMDKRSFHGIWELFLKRSKKSGLRRLTSMAWRTTSSSKTNPVKVFLANQERSSSRKILCGPTCKSKAITATSHTVTLQQIGVIQSLAILTMFLRSALSTCLILNNSFIRIYSISIEKSKENLWKSIHYKRLYNGMFMLNNFSFTGDNFCEQRIVVSLKGTYILKAMVCLNKWRVGVKTI